VGAIGPNSRGYNSVGGYFGHVHLSIWGFAHLVKYEANYNFFNEPQSCQFF